MPDTKGVPPKGFSFFYQEHASKETNYINSLDKQKGIIIMKINNKSYKIDVPFNNSIPLGKLENFFNAGDLVKNSSIDKEVKASVYDFIKSFNVYTRWYDYINYRKQVLK